MKVLIVDDSPAMRMIVKRTLKQAGFTGLELSEAGDGTDALEMIEKSPPDLVISDWNMPKMNGISLLEALNEREINIKFGFVTTESSKEMMDRASEAGAKFLIAKPFTADTFEEALGPIIN